MVNNNNQFCQIFVLVDDQTIISDNSLECENLKLEDDIDSPYNIINKNSDILLIKMPFNFINTEDLDITIFIYFVKDQALTNVFDKNSVL